MSLFLLIRITFIAICFNAVFSVCPEGSIPLHSECYIFFDTPKTYSVAENICVTNGAKLTSVRNELENSDINGQAGRFLTLYGAPGTWLGVNDLVVSNQWVWEDGYLGGFTKWQKGDPKLNDTVNNCGAMWIENGFWYSADCYSEKPFICRIVKPPPPPPPTTTTPCDCNKTTTAKPPTTTKPLAVPPQPPIPAVTTILPVIPVVTTAAAPLPPPITTVPPLPITTQPPAVQPQPTAAAALPPPNVPPKI